MRHLLVFFAVCMLATSRTQAGLWNIELETSNGFIGVKSLSLSDGRKISASDLIGIELTHYRNLDINAGIIYPASQTTVPSVGTRAALLEDLYLNTGLRNIGAGTGLSQPSSLSSTLGIAFSFVTPVVNGPGDDVVIFELGPSGNTMVVSRLDGLGRNLTISSNSQENPALGSLLFANHPSVTLSLSELEGDSLNAPSGPYNIYHADFISFDLSSLGYAPGEVVSGLFLQDSTTPATGDRSDPVLIVGLPPVPECGSGILFLFGSGVVLLRGRRRQREVIRA